MLTSNRARPLHRGVVSRSAVASYSHALIERSRARRERARPWTQSSLGTSRSCATSTAATTSQTSTQGSHMSFIPPPPQRTVARPPPSTSSSARDAHSFIPVPKFSGAQVTTRLAGQGSPASTVFTSSTRPSSTETVRSAKASTLSADASTASTLSSTTCSSANTVSTGSQDSRTSRTSRTSRINMALQDSRCPSAAHTLSSASSKAQASSVTTSSLVRSQDSLSSNTVRPTGTRPPPSTTSSSRTNTSLLGLAPPAKGVRAPSTVSTSQLPGPSFTPRTAAQGTRPPPSTQSLSSDVLSRARAVRAVAESRKASVVDNRKPGKLLHPTFHPSSLTRS